MPCRTILSLLTGLYRGLDEQQIWNLLFQILSALDRLHTNVPPIVHHNLTLDTILLDDEVEYQMIDHLHTCRIT